MHLNFSMRNRAPASRSAGPTGLAPAYDGPPGESYEMSSTSSPDRAYKTTPADVRQATSTRRTWCIITSVCLFLTVLFLIIVEIGNTYNKTALRHIWFIKLDFADIRPIDQYTPGLGYALQQALKLDEFYQVGLWNYCAGNNGTGILYCSEPRTLYWFDPFEIIARQIADRDSITIPSKLKREVIDSLDVIRISSRVMFGLFLTGAVLSFVLIPVVLVGVKSRWASFGLSIITFLNAIIILAAAVIATVIFVIIRDIFRAFVEVINVVPHLGATMFAMMWIATFFAIVAFLITFVQTCCCRSQRDVRRGKK